MHEAGALRVGGARGLADGDRLGDEIVGAIEVQRVLPGERAKTERGQLKGIAIRIS